MYVSGYISDIINDLFKTLPVEVDPAETNILKTQDKNLYLLPTIIFQLASKGLVKLSPKTKEFNLTIEVITDNSTESLSPWEEAVLKGLKEISVITNTKKLGFIETVYKLDKVGVGEQVYELLTTSLMNKGLIRKRRSGKYFLIGLSFLSLFIAFSLLMNVSLLDLYIYSMLYFFLLFVYVATRPEFKRTEKGKSLYEKIKRSIAEMKMKLNTIKETIVLDDETVFSRENLLVMTWFLAVKDRGALKKYFKEYGSLINEAVILVIEEDTRHPTYYPADYLFNYFCYL